MRTPRFGTFLLAIGAAVGAAAVVGLVVGFEPARLPPALLNIAAYKLTVAAAVALLATGAIVLRRGNRDRGPEPSAGSPLQTDASLPAAFPSPAAEDELIRRRDPVADRVPMPGQAHDRDRA
jgi:hypothetical protein